jgi:hypothetical protein
VSLLDPPSELGGVQTPLAEQTPEEQVPHLRPQPSSPQSRFEQSGTQVTAKGSTPLQEQASAMEAYTARRGTISMRQFLHL